MRVGATYLPVLAVCLLVLTGCGRNSPIYNVPESTLNAPPNATMAQIEKAIVAAGTDLGWEIKPEGPGKATGTLKLRTHVAVVDIAYNTKTFSIQYKDSTNLNYSDGWIHPNYSSWVRNLEKAIREEATKIT
jgi:predicted small lipoprotein YifL